eukprot:493655_1
MQLSVENDILVLDSEELSVNITGCPIGYGSDGNNFTCSVCDRDYFNLVKDNVNYCTPCDSDNNPGVSCAHGIITILPNYWMGFVDEANEVVISAKCPSKYCCSSTDGCNYIDDNDKLCATNRDYTSIMCGKCKSGFSESMTSVSCVQCKHGIYIAYILYPMMFALLWTAYITLSSSDKVKSDKKKQTEHKRCAQVRDLLSNDHFMTLFKTMWNRNIMYYEQALSQILASGSLVALGTGFAEVFNFSITNNNSSDDDNLWCFVDGLDAKQKILLDFL